MRANGYPFGFAVRYNEHMIKRVLGWLLVFLLVVLGISWGLGGGVQRATSSVRGLQNPLDLFTGGDTGGALITLPWSTEIPQGPDVGAYIGDEYADPYTDTSDSYTGSNTTDIRQFGDPSPYAGHVHITHIQGGTTDVADEYIVLQTDSYNDTPLVVSGWSFQSVLSRARIVIPQGSPLFVSGAVNTVTSVSLTQDDTVTIVSGPSPIGVGFRENICTGYLGQFQTFTPPLDTTQCPDPADELRTTQGYGDACLSSVTYIPRCHFPSGDTANIPPSCRAIVADRLSYNGCVRAHRHDAGFALPSWRLYVTLSRSVWGQHDTIRLLDEQGRVVDVYQY